MEKDIYLYPKVNALIIIICKDKLRSEEGRED